MYMGFYDLFFFHGMHLPVYDDDGSHKCRHVSTRAGIHDPIDPHEQRQYQKKGNKENDLSCHGKHQSLYRLADRRKEIGRDQLNAVYDDHHQIDPHKFDGKFKIKRFTCPKQRDELSWEKLEKYKTERRDHHVA